MAGHIVSDIKQWIYEGIYLNVPFNLGAALEVGLSTTIPHEDGSNFTEPIGGSYARVTMASTDWTEPNSLGEGANAVNITFPAATDIWGSISHAGIFQVTPPISRGSSLNSKRKLPKGLSIETVPVAFYELSDIIYVSTGIIVEFEVNDFRFGPWALP